MSSFQFTVVQVVIAIFAMAVGVAIVRALSRAANTLDTATPPVTDVLSRRIKSVSDTVADTAAAAPNTELEELNRVRRWVKNQDESDRRRKSSESRNDDAMDPAGPLSFTNPASPLYAFGAQHDAGSSHPATDTHGHHDTGPSHDSSSHSSFDGGSSDGGGSSDSGSSDCGSGSCD